MNISKSILTALLELISIYSYPNVYLYVAFSINLLVHFPCMKYYNESKLPDIRGKVKASKLIDI